VNILSLLQTMMVHLWSTLPSSHGSINPAAISILVEQENSISTSTQVLSEPLQLLAQTRLANSSQKLVV
jgi:hypothetical protein